MSTVTTLPQLPTTYYSDITLALFLQLVWANKFCKRFQKCESKFANGIFNVDFPIQNLRLRSKEKWKSE